MGQNKLTDSISLREVNFPEDDFFLRQLFSKLRLEDPSWQALDDQQREQLLEMQYEAQKQQYTGMFPDADHQIIEFSSEPIGRVWINESPSELICIDITILGEHRNRGIGKLILTGLIDITKQKDQVFSLQVEKTNPASRLYHRLGLEIVRDNGIHWKMQVRAG